MQKVAWDELKGCEMRVLIDRDLLGIWVLQYLTGVNNVYLV